MHKILRPALPRIPGYIPARRSRAEKYVARDVTRLSHFIVNSYILTHPPSGTWVLVDTGTKYSSKKIMRAVEERFGAGAHPEAIVLTHGHIDHSGSAEALARRWDVPVYAHCFEKPFLTGKSDYPPFDPLVGGGLHAFLSTLFPRRGVDVGTRFTELPEDGSLPGLPQWRWIHTPGHTPGHISLFRESDRMLIAGDAFATVNHESLLAMMTGKQRVSRPPAPSTMDWGAARKSVEKLAELDPVRVAAGHGLPMFGEALRNGLKRLARDFSDVAIPKRGRYAKEPARTHRNGRVHLPPPGAGRIISGTLILAGVALGTWMLLKRRR
jgi:glyoxylase-like metal-dependent hydrolase (beta-lactamase superfamily II)